MNRSPFPTGLVLLVAVMVVGVAQAGPFGGMRMMTGVPPLSPEPPLADGAPGVADSDFGPVAPLADPPTPVVSIQVRVPAVAAPGKELEYHIRVENTSRGPAHHVLVRNPLPVNARFVRATPEPDVKEPELQWKLGTLQGCACKEIVLVLQPTGDDVRNCARVQFEHGQCVRTRIAGAGPTPAPPAPLPPGPKGAAVLRVRKTGPSEAKLLAALTYQIELTNAGNAAATNVMLSDTLPDGLELLTGTDKPRASNDNPLTWTVGTLEAGQTRRFEYQASAKKVGSLENKARATADGLQPVEAVSRVVVGEVKLDIHKTGPDKRPVNRPATYQITVGNTGTAVATGVRIVDELAADIAFDSASDGGRLVGRKVEWLIDRLAPGQKRTVRLVVKATKAGRFTNVASVTAEGVPQGAITDPGKVTEFEGAAGLALEIDKSPDPVEVGKQATYKVRVLNTGNAAATKVQVVVEVPAEMKVIDANGPGAGTPDKGKVTFEPLARLEPGKEAEFTINVEAIKEGQVKLKVELRSDQLARPVTSEESTTIFK